MSDDSSGLDVAKLEAAQRLIADAFGGQSPEADLNSADRFARWQKAAFFDPREHYDRSSVKLFGVPEHSSVELITIKVSAVSACEHHYAPAILKATVGYIPGKYFVGYSKIAKMFKFFASKYTMDEIICSDFLREFNEVAGPKGAGILLRGKHFCVISKGGPESDFPMVQALSGNLRTDLSLRQEFLSHASTSWDDGI
ncbi:GTP cyclohydrolase I [Arthrobacter dokdonensis]|uniref:GTP cyclohydrolase I n=1 Tax=Arthrobacter dokdonellae TaxID=2211210 RepID=UPI000DE5A9F8|nr:GTP cyclohydrolase I [Arthrobacter dokdonellae]